MKIRIFITLSVFLFAMVIIQPVRASTGIGFILGEPSGLSLRIDNFPVIGIAWSLDNYFHIHCDYWISTPHIKRGLYWFWGFGGKMIYNRQNGNNFSFGMRVPLGLRYYPSKRVEIFFEIAPGLIVIPETATDFDVGFGMRFIL